MAPKSLRRPGVRYRGKGWQIRIWGRGGKLEHCETQEGPYSNAGLAAAAKRREHLLSRKRLGLPLVEREEGSPIFRDVAARWLASLQIDPDQIRKYWNILNARWLPAYGAWPVSEITTPDIREKLASFGVGVKTQKNYLTPLRGVLVHGEVNPNPADAIKWPNAARGKGRLDKVQRYLPEEREAVLGQLDKFAAHHARLAEEKPTQKNRVDAHWSAQATFYFRVLFGIGLRPGEALALCIEDYDGEFIWIDDQYTRGKHKDTTKTGHARRVYVPKALRPYLDQHPAQFTGGPLFRGYQGDVLKDTKRLNPWWKRAHAHRNVRLPLRNPYTCRHTRAAELLSQGVSPAEAAYELGHSIKMFLEIYSEFIDQYRANRDYSRFESVTSPLPHKSRDRSQNIGATH